MRSNIAAIYIPNYNLFAEKKGCTCMFKGDYNHLFARELFLCKMNHGFDFYTRCQIKLPRSSASRTKKAVCANINIVDTPINVEFLVNPLPC